MRRMLALLLAAWLLGQAGGLPAGIGMPAGIRMPGSQHAQLQPGQGCTVVYATDGEWMLGGNNEDYYNPLTRVWFVPAGAGSFGRVYFGFDDQHAQGGMNDQGLFFDGLGLDTTLTVDKAGKQPYAGNLVDKAVAECPTVECVVGLFARYYAVDAWHWQYMFGDATGESAIIEPQAVIRQQGGYQVATNFYQSMTPPQRRNCPRYRTATEMLEAAEGLSPEFIRDVMDAVHQEGPAQTLYSNVYDLRARRVYLYHFHDYEQVVVLDLAEELAQGYHVYDLPALFPANEAAERWAEPALRRREALIESRLAEEVDAAVLQAYAGEYEIPEDWGAPDQRLTVIAGERSLELRTPDYRQHELFPESATGFFHVGFAHPVFEVDYQVRFGLDEERRVRYLELTSGPESIRMERVGAESFVPQVDTSQPAAAATATPTATPEPTATPKPTATAAPTSMAATLSPTEVDEGADFSWAWPAALVLGIGAMIGWIVVRWVVARRR